AARAVLALYRAYRTARDGRQALAERFHDEPPADGSPAGQPPSEEEVSDFLQENSNHFPELEAGAEQVWRDAQLDDGEIDRHPVAYLQDSRGVRVDVVPSQTAAGTVRRYEPDGRRLLLSEVLPPRSRSFQLAHQIALIGFRPVLDRYVAGGKLSTPDSRALAR